MTDRIERDRERIAELEQQLAQASAIARRFETLEVQLLANVSHELRTPLTPILGHLELVKDGHFGNLTPRLAETIDVVARSAHRLARTVDALMDYSHLAAGRMRFQQRPFDIAKLLQALHHDFTAEAESRGVVLSSGAAAGLPLVHGDPNAVRLGLSHLVENAMKFTPKGGSIAILASMEDAGEAAQARGVAVVVRDSGVGIHAALLDAIFEPFRQGDGSSTRARGGIGLGLAIARGIFAAHGAALAVESRQNVGSTFRVVLPAAAASAPPE